MVLRPYQQDAVDAVYHHLRTRGDNPCVVIPTAGGKTPVMARIVRDAVGRWNGRVLILAHVKELLEQAVDKLSVMAPDLTLKIGVYSASLKSRDTDHPVIVGQVQSIYQRAADLGPFNLILIDEAHLIPPDGEGMYRTFLNDALKVNPKVRLVGLTATPYRMSSGTICSRETLLNHVCYEVGVRELIADGYICPLRSKAGREHAETAKLHVRGGEFVAKEVGQLMNDRHLIESACAEIVEHTVDRKACLVFASNLAHAEALRSTLERKYGIDARVVCGLSGDATRRRVLDDFRAGKLKYLINVNVLTTGFDAPICDCVALVRPTMSPGLYYQMVGRGFRLHPGKKDCLVLDFGDNVVRHGPVDDIKVKRPSAKSSNEPAEQPGKECPECHSVVAAGFAKCPDCGHEFPKPGLKHNETASDAGILSGQIVQTDHEVQQVHFSVHEKRGHQPGDPRTLRVDYECGLVEVFSEWICFEHTGWARQKAESWWAERSYDRVPTTAEEACHACNSGRISDTHEITVRQVAGDTYDRVVGYVLGEKPEPQNLLDEGDLDAVPQWAGGDDPFDDVPF